MAALAQDGEVFDERGFGHRDAERRWPVTPTTCSASARSPSRPPAWRSSSSAGGRALWRLTIPGGRWLPVSAVQPDGTANTRVTIHHLMTHASGIPPELGPAPCPRRQHLRRSDLDRMHPRLDGDPRRDPDQEQIATYEQLMALMASQEFRVLGYAWRDQSATRTRHVLQGRHSWSAPAAGRSRVPSGVHPRSARDVTYGALHQRDAAPWSRSDPVQGTPERYPRGISSPGRQGPRGSMFGNGGLPSRPPRIYRYLEVYRTGGTSHGTRVVSAAGRRHDDDAPHQPIPLGSGYGEGLRRNGAIGWHRHHQEHGGGNKAWHPRRRRPRARFTAVALTNLANAPGSPNLRTPPSTPSWTSSTRRRGRPTPSTRWTAPISGGSSERTRGSRPHRPGSGAAGALYVALGEELQRACPYADGAFLIEETTS